MFQPALWEVENFINRAYRGRGHASTLDSTSRKHAFVFPARLLSVHYAGLQIQLSIPCRTVCLQLMVLSSLGLTKKRGHFCLDY